MRKGINSIQEENYDSGTEDEDKDKDNNMNTTSRILIFKY